jgi:hypothetical protein
VFAASASSVLINKDPRLYFWPTGSIVSKIAVIRGLNLVCHSFSLIDNPLWRYYQYESIDTVYVLQLPPFVVSATLWQS